MLQQTKPVFVPGQSAVLVSGAIVAGDMDLHAQIAGQLERIDYLAARSLVDDRHRQLMQLQQIRAKLWRRGVFAVVEVVAQLVHCIDCTR